MSPAADVITLSSPPERNVICTPRPSVEDIQRILRHPPCATSSSPLPSPSELVRLPTRSKYFATPERNRPRKDVATGKAAEVKQTTTADTGEACPENKPKRRGRKPQPAAQPASAALDTEERPKRTRKKRSDGETTGKKSKNKTITGKVAKARTVGDHESDAKPVDTEQIPYRERAVTTGKEGTSPCGRDVDLQLEPAMKRRLDWTPTKESAKSAIELEDNDGAQVEQNRLGSLLSGYEYVGIGAAPDRAQVQPEAGPTKRRRIEPKSPNSDVTRKDTRASAATTNKKPKTRAKKLTTITARVTARYSESSAECSDSTQKESSLNTDLVSHKLERKPDSNTGFKFPRTIILSPEAALKSLDEQQLVFGTCSQLERAESPALLRDTQIALRESEKELSFSSSHPNQTSKLANASTTVARLETPKNLWSVAARDSEGLLVDAEVVNLIDTPEPPGAIASSSTDGSAAGHALEEPIGTREVPGVSSAKTPALVEVSKNDELTASTAPAVEPLQVDKAIIAREQMPNYKTWTDLSLSRKIKALGFKAIASRSKKIEVLEKCWIAQHGPSLQGTEEDPHNSDTAQAVSIPESTASEPRKTQKRQRNPRKTSGDNTKDQPQPSTVKPAKGKTGTTSKATDKGNPPPIKTKSPGKPTGAPSIQDGLAQTSPRRSFIDVEEIQDSEDELLPSPSQLHRRFFTSPPKPKQTLATSMIPSSPSRSQTITTSSHESREASNAIPVNDLDKSCLPDLGEQITKAVRAQPRQRSSRPSWHEKILMYDPIYLEDFTAWLNTEGLDLVNEDRQVGAGVVRQWCESKGICCCYKNRDWRR
ncbi:hypothetical protein BJX61DRAFT_534615 [Aspergillus egyptiacus]|nr:hypothetical protein BJX61DRAFT_534615 [Aspergillus egyptiacus]